VTAPLGLAGRLAAAFIPSKLTPLLIAGSMALGAFAIAALPREEEPQIIVPMVDVFVTLPGASPAEVEQRVTRPLEKLLWEVPGVEYLYSTSSPGQSMVVSVSSWARTRSGRSSVSTRSCRRTSIAFHPARRRRS
jgi:multidrug efflux pump subunit AcrB